MKVHFLQHVPFEGLGSIEEWLSRQGARWTSTRFFQEKKLPELQQLDFIIAGPGPMSVNDEAELPWLKTEKLFLCDAIKQEYRCWGSALVPSLLQAVLAPASIRTPSRRSAGSPIQAVPASGHYFQFPPECTVFHWHGETFELPEGAVRLVRSPACELQGFQLGRNVIGLQFHLETTPQSVGPLIENSRPEMTPGPYVQSEAEIKATPVANYVAINSLMNNLLNYLVGAE